MASAAPGVGLREWIAAPVQEQVRSSVSSSPAARPLVKAAVLGTVACVLFSKLSSYVRPPAVGRAPPADAGPSYEVVAIGFVVAIALAYVSVSNALSGLALRAASRAATLGKLTPKQRAMLGLPPLASSAATQWRPPALPSGAAPRGPGLSPSLMSYGRSPFEADPQARDERFGFASPGFDQRRYGVPLGGGGGFPYGMAQSSPGHATGTPTTPSVMETPEEVDAYLRSCESRDSAGAGLGRSAYVQTPGSPMSPYRPSPPIRAAQAAAAAPSPAGLGPDAVLRDLHPFPQLDLWTDRLREWMSSRMLRPLAIAIRRAAPDAAAAAAAMFNYNLVVPPLGISEGAPGTVGKAAAAPGRTDEKGILASMVQAAISRAPRGAVAALPEAERRGLAAMTRYLQLDALLRGDLPKGLLAALPPDYVVERVAALAEGTCMPRFSPAGGGDWGGKAWTSDLPDDSQLLLYILCAFLQNPGWDFGCVPSSLLSASAAAADPGLAAGGMPPAADISAAALGAGGPFYVAAVPQRAPDRYSCVLVAPAKPSEKSLAIGLTLSRATPPHFQVYAAGRLQCSTQGRNGLLHALVVFLLFVRQRGGNTIGGARLDGPTVALGAIFMEAGTAL